MPARNEAVNLTHLLPTLTALIYDGPYEVIVVDDDSTDATAQVAVACGAQVISLHELPPGWRGKPHACHRGAQEARGEWSLFVDADTLHGPTARRRR